MSGTFFSLIVKKYDNEFVVSQVGQIILSFDCLIWLFFIKCKESIMLVIKVVDVAKDHCFYFVGWVLSMLCMKALN